MSLVIAATSSGVGKTTVTLALLSFLWQHGYSVQSFKVGPDYIDPMFHTQVTRRPCRNLDPVLTSSDYVRSCFANYSQGVDYVLIEGVMGLFDGITYGENGTEIKDFASTAHLSRLLDLPVLLVIDCSRLSGSVAAIAHGFSTFDTRVKIAGVVLNRVGSDRHLELLQEALESLNLPILGVLRRQEELIIPDRHLGLVPPQEIGQLHHIFHQLAALAKNSFNWEKLLPLLKKISSSPFSLDFGNLSDLLSEETIKNKARIAIARDRAFNFYYQDNFDILEKLGAELIFWSPLEENLPQGITHMYFGGGFPEVFAPQLAENQPAMKAVKKAIKAGIPTIAECGGLMYLSNELIDFSGKMWPMVGVLPTTTLMTKQLTLGYRQATALKKSLLLEATETVWGHEFHRSEVNSLPLQPLYHIKGYQKHSPLSYEGWRLTNLQASYVHLHFGGYPQMARRFISFI